MLRELRIENLALIESLHLCFSDGLTVLTGETGAGKSIILQALTLLTGCRASSSRVRTEADFATVEASFDIFPHQTELQNQLLDMGLPCSDELIIKRILSDGRSKYYINGSLATGRMAEAITENLLDIASQHDHQQLLLPRRHLDFIDMIGGLWPQRQKFTALYRTWSDASSRYRQLLQNERDKEQKKDFLSFQCREIREADIQPDEDATLCRERQRLKASETLTQLATVSHHLLSEEAAPAMAQAKKNLAQMAAIDDGIRPLAEELATTGYQLEDIIRQLLRYESDIPNDPAQLETIDARIDLLQRLKRKYGGPDSSLVEVIAFADQSEEELARLAFIDQELHELAREITELEGRLLREAASLSTARIKTGQQLAETMNRELVSLAFEEAAFEVLFTARASESASPGVTDLTSSGWDRPEFLFSANPGESLKPLAEVASGGELSRLMLALKCILARKDHVKTVIFDEVDAGIGGKAAEAVARKVKELAAHHQVLCITHLHQIASRAEQHFLVTKSVSNQRTRTTISQLPEDLRVEELARMLAGESISQQTLAYAQELISRQDEP